MLNKAQGRSNQCAIQLARVVELIANPSACRTGRGVPGALVDPAYEGRNPSASKTGQAGLADEAEGSTRPPEALVNDQNPSATHTGTPETPVCLEDPHQSAWHTGGVLLADGGSVPGGPYTSNTSINIKKTPDKNARKARAPKPLQDLTEFADMLTGVDPQHLTDWLKVRRAKSAVEVTRSVLTRLAREAAKAGISIPSAIEFCASVEWIGFDAEWYANRTHGKPSTNSFRGKPAAPSRHSGLFTMNHDEGVLEDGSLA